MSFDMYARSRGADYDDVVIGLVPGQIQCLSASYLQSRISNGSLPLRGIQPGSQMD